VFLRGLAHLYNLLPYERRAQHAGHCGVAVEGGTPHVTGGSIAKSSLLEAGSERLRHSTAQSGGIWHFLRLLCWLP